MKSKPRESPRLLVFDLDGTLIFSGGAGTRAINRIFSARYSVEKAFDGIDGRGKTDPAIVSEVFVKKLHRKPRQEELQDFFRVFPRFLKKEVMTSPGYKVVSAIKDFLKVVSKLPYVYLALGTGNIEKGARIKLSRARLNRYFPVGGFATDSTNRPRLLRRAWKKAQDHYKVKFPKNQVFIIGDTPLDIQAGRACGFKTVGICCGMYKKKELLASKPDFFFEDYKNIQAWIKTLGLAG